MMTARRPLVRRGSAVDRGCVAAFDLTEMLADLQALVEGEVACSVT